MAEVRAHTCVPAAALPVEVRAGWLAILEASPDLWSPLLHPDFTEAVGRVRPDARVGVVWREGRVAGVLPHHRRPWRHGRAIGAPFSDVQAVIVDRTAGVGLDDLLRASGLSAWRYTNLGGVERGPGVVVGSETAAIADLTGGAAAFFAQQRAEHAKHFKKTGRLARQVEKEVGALEFEFDCADPIVLDTLIAWKRAQYIRSGYHDVLGPDWTRAFVTDLFTAGRPGARAQVSVLRIGGEVGAVECNLRGETAMHGWLVGFDPRFGKYSPGFLLVEQILENLPAAGLRWYDMGPGAVEYKKYYANTTVMRWDGLATAPGPIGGAAAASARLVAALEAAPIARLARFTGRTRRRLEQIAAAEPSLGGRLAGVVSAARARML